MLARVALADELERVGAAAAALAAEGETVAGVLASEPAGRERLYLCAFVRGEERSWLVLDAVGVPVRDRGGVREAASIAALCELAEDTAGGGHLEELRSQLATLRLTEGPAGIEEAEEAALALEQAVGAPPRVASPGYLDGVGAATRRLEQALGNNGGSPFAAAMQAGMQAVDELAAEVERAYKLPLSPA
jgi:hypothetical protein